jgi:hypothetical protein
MNEDEYWVEPTPQGRWEVVTLVRDALLGGLVEDVLGVFGTVEEAQAFIDAEAGKPE